MNTWEKLQKKLDGYVESGISDGSLTIESAHAWTRWTTESLPEVMWHSEQNKLWESCEEVREHDLDLDNLDRWMTIQERISECVHHAIFYELLYKAETLLEDIQEIMENLESWVKESK